MKSKWNVLSYFVIVVGIVLAFALGLWSRQSGRPVIPKTALRGEGSAKGNNGELKVSILSLIHI